MRVDDCFELGYIVKTHGLNGQVYIQLDVDDPSRYYKMESVFLEQSGNLVPFFIDTLLPQGNRLIASFEEIDTADQAATLTGSKLYLPLDQLPDLEGDQYYLHELIGMEVFQGDTRLGTISAVYQPSAQYLAAVEYQGRELLIPVENGIFLSVDKEKKRISVALPDGLLDIYTS